MKSFKNFFNGMLIAICTLIPGASGGTMAIILGLYDDIIHSCSSYIKDIKSNTIFLLPIALGGLVGFIIFTPIIELVRSKYPLIIQFLFIGMIIGGLPALYKKSIRIGNKSSLDIIFLIIGMLGVVLMSADIDTAYAMATSKSLASTIFLFIAGFIFAIALIFPGISGSFLLLTFGLYDLFLSAIHNFDILFLIPLGLGLIVGILTTSRIIEKLLYYFPRKMYLLIIGFVIGSLKPVFIGIPTGRELIASIIVFGVGFLTTFFLGESSRNI